MLYTKKRPRNRGRLIYRSLVLEPQNLKVEKRFINDPVITSTGQCIIVMGN